MNLHDLIMFAGEILPRKSFALRLRLNWQLKMGARVSLDHFMKAQGSGLLGEPSSHPGLESYSLVDEEL